MTISARGITHFVDDEAIFMTIEEWEREVKMFHKLRNIPFFKNYKKWKNFSLWKKLMRRCIMNNCSQILRKELFLLDKHLRDPIWKLRHLCLNLQKQEFFYSGYTEPNKIEDFRGFLFIFLYFPLFLFISFYFSLFSFIFLNFITSIPGALSREVDGKDGDSDGKLNPGNCDQELPKFISGIQRGKPHT